MERFRQALRELEIEAERFDRRIGSGAVPHPPPEMVDEFVDEVNDLREGLVRWKGPAKKSSGPETEQSTTTTAKPVAPGPGPRRTAGLGHAKPADAE